MSHVAFLVVPRVLHYVVTTYLLASGAVLIVEALSL